jgi:glycosyltransferase involved in cell wall biosynthesis
MADTRPEPVGPIACFFSTSGHSGVDRIAQHLLPAIARRGYRVDLLKVRGHGPELVEQTGGLRIIDLGQRQTYACLPALTRYLRRERPSVLLADKDRVNRAALLAHRLAGSHARLLLRLGTTVSVNLANRGKLERLVQRSSMRHLYPLAHRVLVPSHGVAEDLSAFARLPRRLIQVVPPPVIPDGLFHAPPPPPTHPWFSDPEVPLILGVGQLNARKDFATLVRGFARLRARRHCRLLILGRGGERESLLELGRQLGVAADLDLPGFVADPYPYLAHADLFALASRWEGLGFVLIEALAFGTPVVATDCPSGPAEILDHGRCGPLVPIADDVALADAMEQTLDAPLPAEVLQAAAAPYGVEAAVDAWLQVMGLPPTAPRCSSAAPTTVQAS